MKNVATPGSDITPCNKINNNDGRPGTAVYFNFVQITHQSKKEVKDQKSIQSSTTPDPGYQFRF